jgi:PAS domain S-box-containing protein
MIFVKDAAELRFVRFNRAGEELLGYSRDDLLGKNDYDLFPKEEADFFTSKDREVLARGVVGDIPEESMHTRNKGERILHTKKIAILDERDRPRYLLGISEDITEQKEKEREILRLNAALEQRAIEVEAANKELESFSYSVSHDLRAPLRHINGYVEMLAGDAESTLSSEAKRCLQVIADASRQMDQLIDDLLEFSRMGRAELRETRVDLNDLVRETMTHLETETRGRHIAWTIPPLPDVKGDPAMLKQVFGNLLGNAVKFTRPRDMAQIEIGQAGEEDGQRIFFVRDNGAGFDMKYADKLFGVFERLHRAEEFEGTGIGLANVQRIIARHGGRIWAEAAPDKGATFYFTLKPSA